ncbi:DNA alkylation repair protein [Abyssisolibacter fermentans]|uniref:DNA alkylation repair protein n=1 Tax=Abyssisolibacter fermentans TaxID=1766203 RepID=UPI000829AB9A|nr:DNA alkylation repair protein [Abyssisolibacter fermentans]
MENTTIRKRIFELADEEYKKFQSKLCPNNDNIIGVRLPLLRKLAKQIAKGNWREYLKIAKEEYFEEIMLQGMVIGYAAADIEELLNYVTEFVPKIDNWAVCDSFCSGLKFTKTNKECVWEYLRPYLSSKQEFEMRFGIVMLIVYYIEEDYIAKVLQLLDKPKHEGYYVKMAVAWAVSICFVKFPETTMQYLKNNKLDDFTYNKALQKITESLKVNKETKTLIRNMKRR